MASVNERTMGATEFKAKCLQIADDLASGALASVTVTKRGKPVMIARAVVPSDRRRAFGLAAEYPAADTTPSAPARYGRAYWNRYEVRRIRRMRRAMRAVVARGA